MNIKHEKGKVSFSMRTGKVFVKNTMLLSQANRLVKKGKKVEVSDARGYGKEICVDDTYFFPVKEDVSEVKE